MATLNELYPNIDLSQTVYENEVSFLGACGLIRYLISKLDDSIIVLDMEKDHIHNTILVFSNNILVNTFKIKHLFITTSTSTDINESLRSRDQYIAEFLQLYYLNDCFIHLGSLVNDQINYYMKSTLYYKVNLYICEERGKKVLNYIEIEDNVYNYTYKAIVRDGLVYFTMMFNDDPEKKDFVTTKFNLRDYNHYESVGGYVIDTFSGDYYIVESHYDPYAHQYKITSACYETQKVNKDMEVVEQESGYDLDFIFNFVYNKVIMNYPKYSFLEKLVEMSILSEGEKLTHEHMNIYDMATI